MKSMTCNQLAGAYDLIFQAKTFEEICELSKQHGMKMMHSADSAHMAAMSEMGSMMQDSTVMQAFFDGKRKEFDELPED